MNCAVSLDLPYLSIRTEAIVVKPYCDKTKVKLCSYGILTTPHRVWGV